MIQEWERSRNKGNPGTEIIGGNPEMEMIQFFRVFSLVVANIIRIIVII